jgi:hypothetical protein
MSPIGPVRESILILCRATPADSTKYGDTVCVAGLTDKNQFRRIYPVPFRQYERGGGIPFHKKDWIEATLSRPEATDKRRESRRIDMSTVRVIRRASDIEVRSILDPLVSPNLARLKAENASLGVIRPRILGYRVEILDIDLFSSQRTLPDEMGRSNRRGKVRLGQESYYKFVCQDRSGCSCEDSPHDMQLLDWEVNELYRHIVERAPNRGEIETKMRARMLDWMVIERGIYFLMGTHHRFGNWMVVSILYPKGEHTDTQ